MRLYSPFSNYYTLIRRLLYSSTLNQSIVVYIITILYFFNYYTLLEGTTILWLYFLG